MDEIKQILKKVRWGDYQKEDGSWSYGVANQEEIAALIASYSRELQIDDREVLIGMFEANKDNISVGEIIATLKGQVESIKTEPEGKPNE